MARPLWLPVVQGRGEETALMASQNSGGFRLHDLPTHARKRLG